GAFDVTRAHALDLFARAASEGRAGVTETDVIDTADAMLADAKLGRQATLAAFGALRALAPTRAVARADARLDHVDPVIRALAVELSP
ncbi:MAG TPA: hypothetical protein VL400_27690, partial [Polyangiaceae bacterium]|nr:hypothetical protein [Polyangiaceae bacterium]